MKKELFYNDLENLSHETKVFITSNNHKPTIGIINQKEKWIGGFDGDIDNCIWKFRDLLNTKYRIHLYECTSANLKETNIYGLDSLLDEIYNQEVVQ